LLVILSTVVVGVILVTGRLAVIQLAEVFADVLHFVIVLILILLHLLLTVPHHLGILKILNLKIQKIRNPNEVVRLILKVILRIVLIVIPKSILKILNLKIQKIRNPNEVVRLILKPLKVIRRILHQNRPLRLLNKTIHSSLALDLNLSKKRHVLAAVFGAISLNGLIAINFATERDIVVKGVCARVTMKFSVPIIMMIEDVLVFQKMKLNLVIFLELTTLFVANGLSSTFGPFAFPTIIAVEMELNGENKVVSVAVVFLVIPLLVLQQLVKPPVKLKPDRAPMVHVVDFNMERPLAPIFKLMI